MIVEELLTLSIGVGLAVSVLFSETFGVAAGGMIVPGYLAMNLGRPLNVLLTMITALGTFIVVRALSSFVLVYGRRRTVLMIMVGYVMGSLVTFLSPDLGETAEPLAVIGYIIPGLLAIWLDRQGVIETLSAATTAAVLVRLVLILTVGVELHQ